MIKVRLWRNTFDLMRGMEDPHQIEISVDGNQLRLVTAGGQGRLREDGAEPRRIRRGTGQTVTVRIPLSAGIHNIAASTILRSHAEQDALIKPFLRTTVDGLDITGDPSVDRLTVEGPFNPTGPGHTPSRAKIFVCTPANPSEELPCARKIVSALLRRAYRRPVTDSDLETPAQLLSTRPQCQRQFRGRNRVGAAVHSGQPRVSVPLRARSAAISPLAPPIGSTTWRWLPACPSSCGAACRTISLLTLAARANCTTPPCLEQQVKRMLADPRAEALVDNFAEQWLFLRNLKTSAPDPREFPRLRRQSAPSDAGRDEAVLPEHRFAKTAA